MPNDSNYKQPPLPELLTEGEETWLELERESSICPVLYRMMSEYHASGLPRETLLARYVLYLSRVRRNWIEAENNRLSHQPPRRTLGETYEVSTGENKFRKLR